jgi:hypothetical protein
MTSFVAVASVAVGSALLFAGVLIVVRLLAYRTVADRAQNETAGFSLARYEPMARLLLEEDFLFLASQPGYRPEIGAKWRRERQRIFRLYLRDLAQDFQRLHAEARAVVADSRAESSELVGVLMRQQIAFWRAMAGIELRLWMNQLGLGKAGLTKAGARGLVESIEAMRRDLARFAAPLSAAP